MCFSFYPLISLAVAFVAIAVGGILFISEFQDVPNQARYCKMADDASANLERFKSENHSAFVLGYTGEVGKALVKDLNRLKIFKRVVLIGRREVPLDVGPEFEQKVVDFEKLDEHEGVFENLDTGFCCLGTTKGKAGAKGFVRVDHDYVVQSAEKARAKSCRHFSLVSTQMANKDSWFLYPKTKGQTEEDLRQMSFDRLSIYRPAMLLCDREESRPMERAAKFLLKPIAKMSPTAMTIPVEVVSMGMINNAVSPGTDGSKHEVYENKEIHILSGTYKGCNKKAAAPTKSTTAGDGDTGKTQA